MSEISSETPPAAPHPAPAAEVDGAGQVDQIREILFGAQLREYDQRFARLEARLLQDAAEIREEFQRRCTALEGFLKAELGTLAEAVRAERTAAIQETKAEVRVALEISSKHAAEGEIQNARRQEELRQWISDEARRLTSASDQKHAAAVADYRRELAEIRNAFTARHGLSDLFSELATRLKDGIAGSGK